MLDREGFNRWAEEYEKSLAESGRKNEYPFAGHIRLFEIICEMILEKEDSHPAVLDIGFGTGVLTKMLYDGGCEVYGQDFSESMIRIAREKMPHAQLYEGDLREGIAEALAGRQYDYIIMTYFTHHLDDRQKIVLLDSLAGLLKENGKILIGDIAFEDEEDMERCRREAGDRWDEEEIYIVWSRLKEHFPRGSFRKVSSCAGLLELTAEESIKKREHGTIEKPGGREI